MRKVSGIDVELFEDFRAEKFSGIAHLADSITGIIGSRCRNLEDFSRVQEAPVLRTCDLDPEYSAYFNQVRLTGSLNLKTRAGAVRKISVFAVEMRWREEDREVLHKQLSFASGILASPPGGAGCDTADRSCGIFLFLAVVGILYIILQQISSRLFPDFFYLLSIIYYLLSIISF